MTKASVGPALIAALSLLTVAACSDSGDPAANAGGDAVAAEAAGQPATPESRQTAAETGSVRHEETAAATFTAMIEDVTAGLNDAASVLGAQDEIVAVVQAGPQTETLAFLTGGYKAVDQDVQPALHHTIAKAAWETYRSPAAASQYAADLIHGFGVEKDLEAAMRVLSSKEAADNPAVMMQRASILLDESYPQADREEAVALLRRAAEGGAEAARKRLEELGEAM